VLYRRLCECGECGLIVSVAVIVSVVSVAVIVSVNVTVVT